MLRWFKRFYRSKENLSKNEIDEMMENNDNIVLLDVRSPQEFNEWHMPKAINIPTYEIFEKIQKIIKDKITVFAGQSGAGKSSLLNRLDKTFCNILFVLVGVLAVYKPPIDGLVKYEPIPKRSEDNAVLNAPAIMFTPY